MAPESLQSRDIISIIFLNVFKIFKLIFKKKNFNQKKKYLLLGIFLPRIRFMQSVCIHNKMMQSWNHLPPSHLSSDSRDKYSGKGADIWALGITLYCFIFGKVPYLCWRIWCIVMIKSIFFRTQGRNKEVNSLWYKLLHRSFRFHLMTWTEWVFMRRSEQKSNILSWLKSCFSQTYII